MKHPGRYGLPSGQSVRAGRYQGCLGAAAGQGHPLLAIAATALILLILEIQHLPGLRLLDAGRYSARFRNDRDNDRDQQNHT